MIYFGRNDTIIKKCTLIVGQIAQLDNFVKYQKIVAFYQGYVLL